jgi:NAD(P)H-quinone oxidoreductase subunit 5
MNKNRNTKSTPNLIIATLWGLVAVSLWMTSIAFTEGDVFIALGSLSWGELNDQIGIAINTFTAFICLMASILGVSIAHYSKRYLAGERKLGKYYTFLLLTIVSVLTLVTSNHFVTLLAGWLATSLSLHQLLVFYRDRPAAVIAAKKKFLVSRVGDLALISGVILTWNQFHTLEFEKVFSMIPSLLEGSASNNIELIALLFAIGAMAKSAQVPFHFWLPETMEAPTPISALMHAGVINAGGIFLILMSPLLHYAKMSHFFLIYAGAITSVFGALVMITQNDIKKKLAYSTISQMGLMMLACGFEAYSLALFHIVAHSFYKAHSFLSTGNMVEESKKSAGLGFVESFQSITAKILLGFAVIGAGALYHNGEYLVYSTYVSVLLLGLTQLTNLSQAPKKESLFFMVRLSGLLVVSSAIWFLAEYLLHTSIKNLVTVGESAAKAGIMTCLSVYIIFSIGYVISEKMVHNMGKGRVKLYLFLWNGGYFQQLSSSLMKQMRILR